MKIYRISYDLSNDNLYTKLYEAIKKYDSNPILESVWVIVTNESIDKVLNNLKSKDFTKNDKLIVMKLLLSKNIIEANDFSAEITNWLIKHMKENIKERLSIFKVIIYKINQLKKSDNVTLLKNYSLKNNNFLLASYFRYNYHF